MHWDGIGSVFSFIHKSAIEDQSILCKTIEEKNAIRAINWGLALLFFPLFNFKKEIQSRDIFLRPCVSFYPHLSNGNCTAPTKKSKENQESSFNALKNEFWTKTRRDCSISCGE